MLINSTQQIPKQLTKPHGNSLYLHRLLTNRKEMEQLCGVTRLDEFTLIVTDCGSIWVCKGTPVPKYVQNKPLNPPIKHICGVITF